MATSLSAFQRDEEAASPTQLPLLQRPEQHYICLLASSLFGLLFVSSSPRRTFVAHPEMTPNVDIHAVAAGCIIVLVVWHGLRTIYQLLMSLRDKTSKSSPNPPSSPSWKNPQGDILEALQRSNFLQGETKEVLMRVEALMTDIREASKLSAEASLHQHRILGRIGVFDFEALISRHNAQGMAGNRAESQEIPEGSSEHD